MNFEAFHSPSERIPEGVRFRSITTNDLPFLRQLYASTRAQEMDMLDWTHAQKDAFISLQFEAQHDYYTRQFSKAEFLIVEWHAQPAGRVYIDRRATEIRLVDIALLPAFRNRGLGGSLMEELLHEGQSSMLPVTIHVEKNNPAMHLYTRLGFKAIEEQGVYDLMKWQPEVI